MRIRGCRFWHSDFILAGRPLMFSLKEFRTEYHRLVLQFDYKQSSSNEQILFLSPSVSQICT